MTDTPKKPKRTAIYIEEHDELNDWINDFRASAQTSLGVNITSKQAFAAFLKVAFEAMANA